MYRRLVDNFLYLTTSRRDILFIISLLFRFMHSPKETQSKAAIRVLRYIKGTNTLGIFFQKSTKETLKLVGYINNYWGDCVDDSKSTS